MGPYNSIFETPWWLDAVAPHHWSETIINRGDEIAARLPFAIQKTRGLTVLRNPPLTQTLGPWIRQSRAKYAKTLAGENALLAEIIERLPAADRIALCLSPALTNWLPFYWAGFRQTTYYTYRLDDLTDQELIWSNFRTNIRTDIRKAADKLIVRDDLGVHRFWELNQATFRRQQLKVPYSRDLVLRIDDACKARGVRETLFAEDSKGCVHAAVYIVWDPKSAYYLMGGGDPDLRSSGATSLLLWEAIKRSATRTKAFDFEGSMIKPVERFFRAFGARQTPYFYISKTSRRGRIVSAIQRGAAFVWRRQGRRGLGR